MAAFDAAYARWLFALLITAALLLVACGGDDDGSSSPTPSPGQPVASPTPATPAELDDDPSLPGAYVPPHPGLDGIPDSGDEVDHFANGTAVPICSEAQLAAQNYNNPLCYNSNPPTSGPHAQSPMPFRVLTEPAPKENLVHNMEHGGVVVWYNTTDTALVNQLAQMVTAQIGAGRLVVMSPYSGMEPETIALTSWTRLDKFPVSEYNQTRLLRFLAEHDRRFNPEGF